MLKCFPLDWLLGQFLLDVNHCSNSNNFFSSTRNIMFITLFYLVIGTFPYSLQGKVEVPSSICLILCMNASPLQLLTLTQPAVLLYGQQLVGYSITNLTGHFPLYRSQGKTCFYANFRLAASQFNDISLSYLKVTAFILFLY